MKLASVLALLVAIYNAAKRFLGPASGSFMGHVNIAELVRVVLTALAAAPFGGGAAAVFNVLVTAVQGDLANIFPPADAAFAAAILTAVVDLIRRLGHGENPPAAKPTLAF